MGTSSLGYLLDHVVAGRSILPGAAMFEMAAAAAATLADMAAGRHVALVRVAIPAPVMLKVAGRQSIECVVDRHSGAIQLLKSTSGDGKGV